MKKKTKVKKQRKVVTKPRKVTSKDLDEWAKNFIPDSEFEGVVE